MEGMLLELTVKFEALVVVPDVVVSVIFPVDAPDGTVVAHPGRPRGSLNVVEGPVESHFHDPR